MQEIKLQSNIRDAKGKAVKTVRLTGMVPGVVYGQGKEAVAIQADAKALIRAYHEAGTSRLVDLVVGDAAAQKVLFHEVQQDPLSQQILHFDLYLVRMDEKIKTEVPLHFVGDAPAVHLHNALLLRPLEAIEIEALPADLPENIVVDLTGLTEIGQEIFVKDLQVPVGVEVISDLEALVAQTQEQRVEEEEPEEEISEADAIAAVEAERGGDKGDEAEQDGDEDSTKPPDNDKEKDNG